MKKRTISWSLDTKKEPVKGWVKRDLTSWEDRISMKMQKDILDKLITVARPNK